MTKAIEGPKTCFFIAPIGIEGSEERVRSDQVLKHIVAPAAKDCGYETIRADHISEPGIITSQVIQHVVEDPLVVADLTGRNPNVFYELAIRHVIRRPVVQIIHGSETIPFDLAATRTIHFDHHDLDSAHKAREDITRQIRAVEENPNDVDNPITAALDLQKLRQSDNPLEKSNAAIILMLQEILELGRGQERLIGMIVRGQFIVDQNPTIDLRVFERNPSLGAALLGTFQPNAALSEAVRRIQESSDQAKGALSPDLPNAYARVLAERYIEDQKNVLARIMAEMDQKNPFTRIIAEDEKKRKGSQGEGEKDGT